MQHVQYKIDELIATGRFEPSVRYVFVEGPEDEGFYSWYFEGKELAEIEMLDINKVDVPSDLVESKKAENNCRGRVAAVSALMAEEFGAEDNRFSSIIDSDFDFVLGRQYGDCPVIFHTDYTSKEMYAYCVPALKKYLSLCCPSLKKESRNILNAIQPVLEKLFLIRLTNIKLGWGMKWLLPYNYFTIKPDGKMDFDSSKYVAAYLNKNCRTSGLTEFVFLMDKFESALPSEPRCRIRGHDYFEVLGYYLSKRLKNAKYDSGVCCPEKALMMAIELCSVSDEPMFKALYSRFK